MTVPIYENLLDLALVTCIIDRKTGQDEVHIGKMVQEMRIDHE